MVDRPPTIVLLAHENEKVRESLTLLLKRSGARGVASTGTVKGAWKGLLSGRVHVAFVSWALLAAGDFTLLRARRKQPAALAVPLVAVFGERTPASLDKLLSGGVAAYVRSPYEARGLAEALDAALNSASRQAPASAPAFAKDQAKAHFLKGYGMLKQERYDEAMAAFTRAVQTYELFPEAYRGAAKASSEQGDDEGAGRFLHKAAETCVYLERDDEAEELYDAVMNVAPKAPDPFKTAAARLREDGRLDRAARAYERAFSHSPKDDEVVAGLSRTYLDMGEREKAEEFLRDVLGMEGEFPLAAETFLDITGQDFYGKADGDAGTMQILGDLKGVKAGPNTRGAARLPMADLSLRIAKHKDLFSVVDASVTGVGFKPMSSTFTVGEQLRFDLIAMGDPKLKKLEAVVRRVTDAVVGCEYVKLGSKQRKTLTAMFGVDETARAAREAGARNGAPGEPGRDAA
ncbi:MAG: tetratricopeptide repeat protein [Desulfovibrionaceae bacterium]|nr:tetratricopeptide repeat protein [Desulfovibrionaceae bacterium]